MMIKQSQVFLILVSTLLTACGGGGGGGDAAVNVGSDNENVAIENVVTAEDTALRLPSSLEIVTNEND